MAQTPLKQVSYQVGYNNERDGIPFYVEGRYYNTIRQARAARREQQKTHPDAFVVKVTEERMTEA
jgi:hypothetical protein